MGCSMIEIEVFRSAMMVKRGLWEDDAHRFLGAEVLSHVLHRVRREIEKDIWDELKDNA